MELLSPAGHWESMVAAVQNGANAIYLGCGSLNARRSAKNFTCDELPLAVEYCHLRGVRVYLTLNTLLSDRELTEAAELLRLANRCGVDAVIVQDWGVAALARAIVPDLPLHGSTQMTIHDTAGVAAAAALGLSCVVLSRELSAPDIRAICEASPIKIEVFVHGALCMCYSGQCSMSALIGGRSGNRGGCAQPCRLPYRMDDGKVTHPLSLKDANLCHHLQELEEMGVAILKLEGRMKRPEYVAVITSVYAALLKEHRTPTNEEWQRLEQAFSRSGFTDGYWQGRIGSAMFGTRPENTPEPADLFAAARAAYEKGTCRLVPVTFSAALCHNTPATLTATDDRGNTVTVTGAIPEAARHRELTGEELAARLSKTGGTAFTPQDIHAHVESGLSLSAGEINGLRRSALNQLAALRTAPPRRWELSPPPRPVGTCHASTPKFSVSLTDPHQLSPELLALRPAILYLPAERIEAFDTAMAADAELSVVLPRICTPHQWPALRSLLKTAQEKGCTSALVGNLGQIAVCRSLGFAVRGDFGLNVFNSYSLAAMAEQGLVSATLSYELRHEQMRDIAKTIPCEAIVYGRLPLMITENCVIANALGCKERNLCGTCRTAHALTDRRQEKIPVISLFGCRSELQNPKTLFLADKPDYRRCGLSLARLRFTTESAQQCVAVLERYLGLGDTIPSDLTRGLFYRGVE